MENIESFKPQQKIADMLGQDFFQDDIHPYTIERLQNGTTYEVYYAIAAKYKPLRILEFGVADGWSVIAMAMGYPEVKYIEGYDSEVGPISLKNANKHIDNLKSKGYCKDIQFNFIKQDTWHVKNIEGQFDLVHVDGDWIYTSVKHDLQLALSVNPKVILIDDTKCQEGTINAMEEFIFHNKDRISNIYKLENGGIKEEEKGLTVIEIKC